MIDHIGMPVRDLARSTEFYLKALAPLGIAVVMEVSAEASGHGAAVGFGADFKPFFWIGEAPGWSGGHVHVAFVAPNRAERNAFRWPATGSGTVLLLVFDEKYQLMGVLTLRDIIIGLEPKFLQETSLIKMDPSLTVLMGTSRAQNEEQSQRAVSEAMSPINFTVNAEDPITKPLYLMVKENVGLIPVMRGGKGSGHTAVERSLRGNLQDRVGRIRQQEEFP